MHQIFAAMITLLGLFYVQCNTVYAHAQISSDTASKETKSICNETIWLDNAYCHLLEQMDDSANQLNQWFVGENSKSIGASTKGKISFGWEPRVGDLSEFDFRFKVRAKLPALEERVELIFSDQDDDINEQDVKAARPPNNNIDDQTVLALQFKKNNLDKVSYRVGFGRSFQLYSRARYSDRIQYSNDSALYYYSEINYYSRDKFGLEFNANYVYRLNQNNGFDFNNTLRYRDISHDWLWRHQIQFIHLGKHESSYTVSAMIDGLSQPRYQKHQMLLSFKVKRKAMRDWLFFEIEPFILWLRKENFRASWGVALRTEIRFSTN